MAEILKGEQLYDQALAMMHRRDYCGAHLGSIAFQRNQYAEAKKWWKRCLEWESHNVEAARGLRMINTRSKAASSRSGIMKRLRGKKD